MTDELPIPSSAKPEIAYVWVDTRRTCVHEVSNGCGTIPRHVVRILLLVSEGVQPSLFVAHSKICMLLKRATTGKSDNQLLR